MNELKEIAKTIKSINLIVGEVLEEKLKENNLKAFALILSNFINLNCK